MCVVRLCRICKVELYSLLLNGRESVGKWPVAIFLIRASYHYNRIYILEYKLGLE